MFHIFTAGIFAVVFFFIFVRGNVEIDPGVVIHQAPSVVIAQKNSPLLLNCSATSSPDAGPVEFTWYKDGEPVVTDKFLQTRSNGSLFFSQVKNNRNSKNKNRNHNGFYECFLKNKYGTVIARQVRLKVARVSKSFSIEPKDQEVSLGGVARFECHIEGIPPPLYVWEKDSSHLPRDSRFVDLHSGILQIHNVTESDAGLYHCSTYQSLNKVNNVRSTIDLNLQHSREARLNVIKNASKRPPTIIAFETEVNAVKENSVTLECLADGNPLPTVSWRKDDQPAVDGKFKESIGGSNLRFIKVDERVDAGNYSCVASSPGFPDVKAVTHLNVQVPPFMIEAPVGAGLQVARRFRLKCTVGGTPKPKVTWYKNGKKIESNGRMQINPANELLIDSSASDSGYYQCIAKNDVGIVMSTARLFITLKDKAPKPPGNVTITMVTSRRVCIKWSPSEYPPCCPVLAYTVHHTAVTDVNSFDTKDVTLEKKACIDDLKPVTKYRFFVRAYTTNGAGPPSETVTVKTKESVPEVPPNVRVYSSSPTNIEIEWDNIPFEKRNGIITGYKVYILKGDQLTKKDVPAAHNNYTATGLQPDSEYQVRVLACTSVGCPSFTDNQWPWQSHKTPENTEESRVNVRLHVTQLNLTCVDVKWNLTDKKKVTRRFKIYISQKIEPESARVFALLNTKERNYIICDLESEKFYEVMFVVDGPTDPLATVEEIFQTVPPDKNPLPLPPVGILARAISSSEILISWKRPRLPYDIKFYMVKYYRVNKPSNVIFARSDTVRHILKDLDPFTTYSIRVRSHTAQAHGIFSDPVEVETMEDVPSAPEKLYIVHTDKDKVTLQWKPPAQRNGVIISYVVLYNRQKDVPERLWQSQELNGTLTEATISGIESNTNYYFKVGACTKQGPGHYSQTVEMKPLICTIPCNPDGVKPPNGGSGIFKDQRLGVIIGCSIGLSSIIICIVVVVVRQRYFARMYRNSHVMNGNPGNHSVGQYLSNHSAQSPYHMVDEGAPMLEENIHADTKGPDNTVRFQGNGQIIYFCNGKTQNGKIRAYVASPISNGQAGERTALITSRSAGHMAENKEENSDSIVTHSHSDGNVRSLPQTNSERGYKYEDRKSSGNSNDIDTSTSKIHKPFGNSQASGASQGQGQSAGSQIDLKDSGDLISKMLQATTSNLDTSSDLPQRSGVKSGVAMEVDLLSVDA